MAFEIKHGDCLEVMRGMADNSVDAIVTDPPYGLSFMGKKWDYDVPGEDIWRECLRVLKPGGHLLAFAGTRTQHRMAVRIEDAGFEIRDMIAWVYGSGFPKSLAVDKAIDRMKDDSADAALVAGFLMQHSGGRGLSEFREYLNVNIIGDAHSGGSAQGWTTTSCDGVVKARVPTVEQWAQIKALLSLPADMDAEVWRLNGRKGKPGENWEKREVLGTKTQNMTEASTWATESGSGMFRVGEKTWDITAPATPAARQWQGWGTALKPSAEPVTFARKPLDIRGHCVYLAQYLTDKLCQYAANVKNAVPSSSSSPSASSADQFDFALWTAVERCNTPGDLFALMDTLLSASHLPLSLSTALSWLRTLDGLLQHESTFTTETASSLTTDLKTLNSLLLSSTQSTTIEELTEPSGHGSNAELVACIFNACDASLKSTLARSAHESAIARAQEHYLDAGVSPALEPITMARKPFAGTVAANVLEHGTGALNVDGCRVATTGEDLRKPSDALGARLANFNTESGKGKMIGEFGRTDGKRWPANLIHDGSDEVVGLFPQTPCSARPNSRGVVFGKDGAQVYGKYAANAHNSMHNDTGSAARFFYCAKASKADRDEGLDHMPEVARSSEFGQLHPGTSESGNTTGNYLPRRNHHPTVKPTALMRYLCRLITPPGGTVLDPFMGSGSAGKAAMLEGFEFIGIEREAEYVAIAEARIGEAQRSLGLFA